MVWHQWTFYTSLVVWVVAGIFITPEENEDPRSFSKPRSDTTSTLTWQNIGVTLICAGIMCLGYQKLRLYLDKMTNALAATRTRHNDPDLVDGVSAPHLEEVSTVTPSFVDCHDRLSSFISDYSREIHEAEKKIRDNVKHIVDDVAGWNVDISKIMWEMRTESRTALLSSSATENLPRRCRSADSLSPRESITPLHTPPTPIWSPPVPGISRLRAPSLLSKEHRGVHLASPEAEEQAALKPSLRQLGRQAHQASLYSPPHTPVPSRPPMLYASRQALRAVRMKKIAAIEAMLKNKSLLKTSIKPGHSDAHKTGVEKPIDKSPTPAKASSRGTMSDVSSQSSSETSATSQEPTSTTTTSKTEDSEAPEAQRIHEPIMLKSQDRMEMKGVAQLQLESEPGTRPEVHEATKTCPEVKAEEEPAECTAKQSTSLPQEHQLDMPQPTGASLPVPTEPSRLPTPGTSHLLEKFEDMRDARASEDESNQEKSRNISTSTESTTHHEQGQTKQE